MFIKDRYDLIYKLKKNNGKIILPSSYLISINNVTIHNSDECDIKMIYSDLDLLQEENALIEFCDQFGMLILSVLVDDLFEFEIIIEYDEDGYIK
jgi:hypothetical protein